MDDAEMSFREWFLGPVLKQGREIIGRLEGIEEKVDQVLARLPEPPQEFAFIVGPVTEQEE